jgi:hypothetical protein
MAGEGQTKDAAEAALRPLFFTDEFRLNAALRFGSRRAAYKRTRRA